MDFQSNKTRHLSSKLCMASCSSSTQPRPCINKRQQQISAFLTVPVHSPESAGESQSDGGFSDSSTQRRSAGPEGEGEGQEGGGQSLAEQQRGQRERGEEAEGQPGEEGQTHRGKGRNMLLRVCACPHQVTLTPGFVYCSKLLDHRAISTLIE